MTAARNVARILNQLSNMIKYANLANPVKFIMTYPD